MVDDEAPARRYLTLLLQRDPDVESVIECGSGLEAIEQIRRSRPDLVFLDVQMPECDGFDVLELLGADLPETVIFVTAYAAYALRAFDAGALDYILKPLDHARFSRALERAKGRLARGTPYQAHSVSRIAVKSRGQTLFLKASEIDWIEAARYYACLHLGDATHIVRRTILELEQDLDPRTFFRIHRSIIVNLERVRGLELQENGEYEVVLDSKIHLKLSRRFRKRFQDRLGELPSGGAAEQGTMRGNLLPGVCAVRSSEQSCPGARRGATLDRAHHDFVGPAGIGPDVGAHATDGEPTHRR